MLNLLIVFIIFEIRTTLCVYLTKSIITIIRGSVQEISTPLPPPKQSCRTTSKFDHCSQQRNSLRRKLFLFRLSDDQLKHKRPVRWSNINTQAP